MSPTSLSLMVIRFDPIPADRAEYMEFKKAGATKKDQAPESGAYFATYAMGNATIGYSKGLRANLVADSANTGADYYDQTNMSVSLAVNDDLSTILPNINTKVNLIYGEDDLVVPIRVGIDSSSIIPDSELTIIPDEGHNMLRSSSEKIIEIIKK